MARTELFVRKQSGGVFTVNREDICTGNIFFVNSVTGTNSSGYGNNPDSPFASLDYAASQVTSNNGDRVYLMPGHVETLTAAGSALGNGGVFIGSTLSNGVEIIGLGRGRNRPKFNYTTAVGASMNVAAANVTIRNCVFTPNGIDNITAAINVTGADFWMDNCDWEICNSAADKQMAIGILTAATATRFKVTNTSFRGPATVTGTTCSACIKHEVGVDFEIDNCDFHGKMTQGILNATTVLGGKIHNCRFQIYTGTKGIALAAATTALITNNRFNVPSGTAPIVAAAGFVAGNIYSAAAGVTAGTASTI